MKKFFNFVSHQKSREKRIKVTQDSYKLQLRKFYTDMRKNYPYRQARIYACIFQIIWQYKKNFHKTIQRISKSLSFLFNHILESSVDCLFTKAIINFLKVSNFYPT